MTKNALKSSQEVNFKVDLSLYWLKIIWNFLVYAPAPDSISIHFEFLSITKTNLKIDFQIGFQELELIFWLGISNTILEIHIVS